MKVYLAADHRGFFLKEKIKEMLVNKGMMVKDFGNQKYEKDDDYTDFAFKMGESLIADKAIGIAVCGSGVGIDIALNKIRGIRAALCTVPKQAWAAKNDDNANVLVLSADWVSEDTNMEIIEMFISSVFSSEERHIRRLRKIENYES